MSLKVLTALPFEPLPVFRWLGLNIMNDRRSWRECRPNQNLSEGMVNIKAWPFDSSTITAKPLSGNLGP